MNYKLIQNNSVWEIFEIETKQVIKKYTCFSKAKKKIKHLNLGGGFDGYTPTFFLINIPKT